MITVSEYLRANTNIEECGNLSINNTNITTCKTTNWMYNIVPSDGILWTISPNPSLSARVFNVFGYASNAGYVSNNLANGSFGVSPAVYLSSDITLQGTGTELDPYVITN